MFAVLQHYLLTLPKYNFQINTLMIGTRGIFSTCISSQPQFLCASFLRKTILNACKEATDKPDIQLRLTKAAHAAHSMLKTFLRMLRVVLEF